MRVLTRLIVGFVGVGLVAYGVKERQLAAVTGDTPVRMTCKELGDAEKLPNAHVILTDFVLMPNFVYQGKESRWTKVWAPSMPIDSEYVAKVRAAGGKTDGIPLPRPVKVVVTSDDVRDTKEFEALADKDELQGVVINEIEEMDGKRKELLEETYGDVSRAKIFAVGRKPAAAAVAYGLIGAGGLLALWVLRTFLPKGKAGGGGGAASLGTGPADAGGEAGGRATPPSGPA